MYSAGLVVSFVKAWHSSCLDIEETVANRCHAADGVAYGCCQRPQVLWLCGQLHTGTSLGASWLVGIDWQDAVHLLCLCQIQVRAGSFLGVARTPDESIPTG